MRRKNYNQEPEDTDSEDGFLKQKRKLRDNKKLVCQTRGITRDDDNEYRVHYDNDGVNKTVTYESIINKPNIRGKAKLTLHKTKNMQGYHFEARTQYNEGYQLIEQTKNGEEYRQNKQIKMPERLPKLTMNTFSIEPLEDDDEEFEAEDQNDYDILEHPPEEKPEIRNIKLKRNGGT